MRGRGGRIASVLALVLASAAAGWAAGQQPETEGEYQRLVARYRSGDTEAAASHAVAVASGAPLPRGACGSADECQAVAVLNLHAASLLFGVMQVDRARAILDATRPLVSRPAAAFAFAWLLAAGSLHQAYADHARAFGLYAAALELRPGNSSALLARATALEFSAIPDGFGAVVVADRDVWSVLYPGGQPPRELSSHLANRRTETPYRRVLLEFLTRQYRALLDVDSSSTEARLRLGRVLQARGRDGEAEVELRAIASDDDRFCAAVARLCLARVEVSPERAADAYRSALAVDPTLSPAWLGLSQSLHASGDRGGALEALDRALSLGRTRALNAWVDYHLGRGRAFPEALAALRAGLTPPR
ncbi:MAG TPA: hypothetical protein VLL75_08105 [Vicinamibacteria bacterium]|nr:hypothetical protein [Vicinamibacteria bacterium]